MKSVNCRNNILFILRAGTKIYGTERTLLNWCKFIDPNSYKILIATPDQTVKEYFLKKIENIEFVNFIFDDHLIGIRRFISRLRYFQQLKVSKVVWIFYGMGSFFPCDFFASWIVTSGRVYISHHNYPENFVKVKSRKWFVFIPGFGMWRVKNWIKMYILHVFSRKILAVSEEVKTKLINYWKIPSSKIYAGKRGVDCDIFYNYTEAYTNIRQALQMPLDSKVFIAVNRFAKEKRIDRLLGSFLLLKKYNSDAYLLIVGDGYLMDYYKKRIARNKTLSKYVKLLGHREDTPELISASDFLLLASDFEGESNIVKEAMACGIIPIVTDSYGVRNIGGNIFISGKNIFSYFRKIKSVMSISPFELAKMKKSNIAHIAQKYNLQKCVEYELRTFGIIIKEPEYV